MPGCYEQIKNNEGYGGSNAPGPLGYERGECQE